MSIAMVGKGASYEFRWRRWALLRDAVVTHLADSRFPLFESIGDSLGVASMRLPAASLAREIREIRARLAKRCVDDLVLAPLTAKVLYPKTPLEVARPLTRTELSHVAPIGDEKTLDQYFASKTSIRCSRSAHTPITTA